MKKIHILLTLSLFISQLSTAQEKKTDANVFGHVVDATSKEHIPFATILVKGTTVGTTTDESGHYQLLNLPAGTYTVVARYIGYKPTEQEVTVMIGKSSEIKFDLEKDVLGLEEIVITGDRNETNRKESSTIVNTVTPKIFATTQSVTLSEGLNFCPGLRMENNCQNCGFTQVRMNGMEGPYSQILINSRPIFSGLAGVYGLELIPSNMIERVEIIRGSGSALYGSNAVAGTINLILKDPIKNTYEFGASTGLIGTGLDGAGDPATDYTLNFNTSLVSADSKTGMSLYGFYRDREPFDANDDTYSEIASLKNTTIGSRIFHRFSTRNKITLDFFNINEERRGGDQHDKVAHEANIAEALTHHIITGALTYEQFFREHDLLSIYGSGQNVKRESYYGAEQSLSDYGNTKDFSYAFGAQYDAHLGESSELVFGTEYDGAWLKDKKLGYYDVENDIHTDNVMIADQAITTFGVFAQYEVTLNKFKASVGARFDSYSVSDEENETDEDKTGNVVSPRITLKYDIADYLQARVSYSQGYRAPQIFDEDLHIETSGSKQVLHTNDPDLKQETSSSIMASLDFNKQIGNSYLGILVEGFYTQLTDPFANEFGEPDVDGTVTYTRINAEGGATVAGANIELNFVPVNDLSFKAGFTIQNSEYEEAQEFDEKRFFRTPDDYGYFTLDWQATKNFGISSTGNYTSSMLVPFGEDYLVESDSFFDLGLKLRYNTKLNGATLQVYGGMKNIFNSYQDDFDEGLDREPGYIYGPLNPQTIYFGIKIGNIL